MWMRLWMRLRMGMELGLSGEDEENEE